MKHHLSFLSFCLLLAALLLSSPIHAADTFLIDIHLNSAEAPSLSFGETDTEIALTDLFPAPPFSGMFGVVDIYFENTHPTFKDSAWYDRLSTDRKLGADSKWILVANSKAKLTWKLKTGAIPANLKIAWIDEKTQSVKFEAIVTDASFNVKPGTVYTIQGIDTPTEEDLEISSNDTTGYSKKVDGELTPITFNFNPPGDGDSYTLRLSFNAGISQIRYKGEVKPDALWEVEFVAPGYTSGYAWDVEDTSILIVTLTKNPTREAGVWQISLNPVNTTASPIEVTETNGVLDDTTRRGIVLRLGTLDFDGDGKITNNDVMFLYNYVTNNCPPATETWFTYDFLLPFTDFAVNPGTATTAQTALQYFQENLSDMNFDETGTPDQPDNDDAMYLYNFYLNGCQDETQTWFTSDLLLPFAAGATLITAEEALARLREYMEGLIVE